MFFFYGRIPVKFNKYLISSLCNFNGIADRYQINTFILYTFCFERKKKKTKSLSLIFFFYKMVSFLFHSAITRMFPNFISDYVTKNCRWNEFFFKKEKKQLSFTFLTTQITKQYPKEKNKQTQQNVGNILLVFYTS